MVVVEARSCGNCSSVVRKYYFGDSLLRRWGKNINMCSRIHYDSTFKKQIAREAQVSESCSFVAHKYD